MAEEYDETVRVQTTTLESLTPANQPSPPIPAECRLERVESISPEYARFLYCLVGGPWFWTDRLGWTREEWVHELAVAGTEFWVLYAGGAPQGYLHLQSQPGETGAQVEIRYFGLAESAIGKGWGRLLLEHGIAAAWTLSERQAVPPTERVWVHTCTLDGPAALANYQARGFQICDVSESEEDLPATPLGSWVSSGGPR